MEENQIKILLDKVDDLKNILHTSLFPRASNILFNRAVDASADYVEKNMPDAIIISSNLKSIMWKCAIDKAKVNGHIAEFGVYQGESINFLADLIYPKTIFGFDSFFGLEEDFVLDLPKGSFNLNGVAPTVKENVKLVEGSFSDTLPKWLNENSGVFSLLNIDCDTYESTSTVLNFIGPERIVPGTLILFDEYLGYHGWKNCEFKAWQEYCNTYNVKYKYVAVCHLQTLVEIL